MTPPGPDDPASFWNEKFNQTEYRYGTSPNAFVESTLPEKLTAGASVLCVGDGEGRNGVWCAEQGFETTSIEPSSVGAQKIEALAKKRGVEVTVICDRMPSAAVEANQFDAVVLTFIHAPPEIRRQIHSASIEALAPGGLLVLEAFTPAQRENNRPSGGPPSLALLFTPEMLQEDFEELEISQLSEEVVELGEGAGHRGPADVVRLIARKPVAAHE